MKRPAFTPPQVLCRPDDVLGEGALWDHRASRLLWIDILRGRVHSWSDAEGMRDVVALDALIGSVALAGKADLLIATSEGLLQWMAASGEVKLLADPLANRPVRFNDGRVDSAGRFWVGTMALDEARNSEPLGELYRYDPDGRIHRMEQALTISNGLDWSPDGRTFYLTDTMRRLIYAYDFDVHLGAISHRRVLISVDEAHGFPDGLVVDSEGSLWSACITGGALARYNPQGRLVEKVAMPVSCPTSIAFGGEDYSTIFVTTSRHLLKGKHGEPHAGALLSMTLPARGHPAAVFGSP